MSGFPMAGTTAHFRAPPSELLVKRVLQALVLADHIYQDKLTGKMIIAGTFTQMFRHNVKKQGQRYGIQGLPSWKSGAPHAYIRLTEVRGEATLELRFVDLSENKPLLRADLAVSCKDPLESIELNVPLPELPVSSPGHYSLELLHENELLGSWNVTYQILEHAPDCESDTSEEE